MLNAGHQNWLQRYMALSEILTHHSNQLLLGIYGTKGGTVTHRLAFQHTGLIWESYIVISLVYTLPVSNVTVPCITVLLLLGSATKFANPCWRDWVEHCSASGRLIGGRTGKRRGALYVLHLMHTLSLIGRGG